MRLSSRKLCVHILYCAITHIIVYYYYLILISIISLFIPDGLVALSCQDNADDVLFSMRKEKAIRKNEFLIQIRLKQQQQ